MWYRDPRFDDWSQLTGLEVGTFADSTQLATIATARRFDGLFLSLAPGTAAAVRQVIAFTRSGATLRMPILVEMPTQAGGFHLLKELYHAQLDVRLVAAGHPELYSELAALMGRQRLAIPMPADYLLTALARDLPADLLSGVAPLLFLGQRKARVNTINYFSIRSSRSLRRLLGHHHIPAPRSLLGYAMGFSVAYLSDITNAGLRLIAANSGFSSEESLRRYLQARTARSPSTWKELGVPGALALIAAILGVG
jgi:hypothetical protein